MYIPVYVASCSDCKTLHCLQELLLLYLPEVCDNTFGALLGPEYFDMGWADNAQWLVNLCAFHHHAGVPKGTASPGLLHHHNQEQKQKCNASHAIKTHVIQIIQRHAHTQKHATITTISYHTSQYKMPSGHSNETYNHITKFFSQHDVIHGPYTKLH
jgi:hypothetical protein